MSTPDSEASPRPHARLGVNAGAGGIHRRTSNPHSSHIMSNGHAAGTGTGSATSTSGMSPDSKGNLAAGGSAARTPSNSDLAAEAEAKRRKVQRACDVCRR